MIAAVLVSVARIVVTCVRARSAAGHNSARAPERVLRRRRVRSCPFETDASGGDDQERRPTRPFRAARLVKYLAHPLSEPAWRDPRQPRPGLGGRVDGGRYVRDGVWLPAVRDRNVGAPHARRDT